MLIQTLPQLLPRRSVRSRGGALKTSNQKTKVQPSSKLDRNARARNIKPNLLDKLKEFEADAPPQLKKLIARARKLHLGSAEFRTRAILIVTAVQSANWLDIRPLGFLRAAQPSRVCNPTVRWDNCIAGLYARRKATLDRARRGD